MAGIGEKAAIVAAGAVAKPVLEAVIGPKLERFKQWWASENDLAHIESAKFLEFLQGYYEVVLNKVSKTTTIALPRHQLDTLEAYQPVKLVTSEKKHIETDELVDDISYTDRSYVLIDFAGMGKTTFCKYLINNLLIKSDKTPVFVELRLKPEKEKLYDYLVSQIRTADQKIDDKIFDILLGKGRFVFVFDGFDEVADDNQHDLMNEIHDLSCLGSSTILLTSRPQSYIPRVNNSEVLEFNKFHDSQAANLIQYYDKISGNNLWVVVTDRLLSLPNEFNYSPLLASILYRVYSFNGYTSDNVSGFYSDVYQVLYKDHDVVNKSGFQRIKKSGLDIDHFRSLLRALCYYMMLTKKFSFKNALEAKDYIKKAIHICQIEPDSIEGYLDDLTTSVPIMVIDGVEYKFFHRTFVEYFAAEHIVNHTEAAELTTKIFNSKNAERFDVVFGFIYELNDQLYHSVVTKYFAEKIISYCDGKNKYSGTLSFLYDYEIALSHSPRFSPRDSYSGNLTVKFSVIHFLSIEIKLPERSDQAYYPCLAYVPKHPNLFEDAWRELTERYQYDKEVDPKETKAYSTVFDELYAEYDSDVTKFRSLQGADRDQIQRFETLACYLKATLDPTYRQGNSKRIISIEKAKSFLQRYSSHIKAESELDDLLM